MVGSRVEERKGNIAKEAQPVGSAVFLETGEAVVVGGHFIG